MEYVTLELENHEAFFLFKMIGFQEITLFNNLYEGYTSEELNEAWEDIKYKLIEDNIIVEDNNEIVIEPTVFTLLQSCKLSNTIVRFHLYSVEEEVQAYYFISSNQIIEIKQEQGSSIYRITVIPNLQDYINIIGNQLEASKETSTDKKESMNMVTYDRIMKEFRNFTEEDLHKYLIENEKVSKEFASEFISSLQNYTYLGEYTVSSRGVNSWEGQSIQLITGVSNNWLVMQNQERVEVFNVNDIELVESIYLVTVASI
ncbi:hypothetical protein [Bacillus sp. C1]